MFNKELIGIGLYSVAEASRLTSVPKPSIRRWLLGYRYADGPRRTEMPPVWHGDILKIDGVIGLSFLDLMEIRFVDAFRGQGVSWMAIREAASTACDIYKSGHPFAMRRFRTDGKRIFADIHDANRISLIDLNKSHYVLEGVVERSLYDGVEFDGNQVARWFPKAGHRKVVIDPQRAFGKPVLFAEGIPTAILAKAVQVEKSEKAVAKWYDVPITAVRAAVRFERQLPA